MQGFCCLQVMTFPVVMLVRFWANHHLLDLTQRPIWRVVKDRSRTYVEKILQGTHTPTRPSNSSAKASVLMLHTCMAKRESHDANHIALP